MKKNNILLATGIIAVASLSLYTKRKNTLKLKNISSADLDTSILRKIKMDYKKYRAFYKPYIEYVLDVTDIEDISKKHLDTLLSTYEFLQAMDMNVLLDSLSKKEQKKYAEKIISSYKSFFEKMA